jgi:hypothetical protein
MGRWHAAKAGEVCDGCGDQLEEGQDAFSFDGDNMCEGCYEDAQDCSIDFDAIGFDDGADYYFADPGGRSALRAESESNPRNLPCGECGRENILTPLDKSHGYVCDFCADQVESGY